MAVSASAPEVGWEHFFQIVTATRSKIAEFRALRLGALASDIAERYAEPDWSPIQYLNRSFSQRSFVGFLRLSQVGLGDPITRWNESGRKVRWEIPPRAQNASRTPGGSRSIASTLPTEAPMAIMSNEGKRFGLRLLRHVSLELLKLK